MFSNKGYHLAASWDSCVKLFDMRKGFSFTEIPFEGASSLSFDSYGSYLLASDGSKIGLYAGKQWAQQQSKVDESVNHCRFTSNCGIVGVNKNKVAKYLIKQ